MPPLNSAIYTSIVRELATGAHEPGETPIPIVCQARGGPGRSEVCGAMSLRLQAGTTPETPEAARAIANTLQARVQALCHFEASGDEAG